MLDLIYEIGQTLRNNRLRTTLTGLSVAWGVFMLILLLGAARGTKNSFDYNMQSQSTNIIQFWGGYTSQPYKGYKEGRSIQLRGSDIGPMTQDVPQVSTVSAFASVDTANITHGGAVLKGGFNAVYENAWKEDDVEMLHGRFINERDLSEGRRVFVIHEKNARLLFDNEADAIGKTVRCMNLAWTVVGVYAHRWRNTTYAPYTTYKKITGGDDKAYQLTATVDNLSNEEDAQAAEKALRQTLSRQHSFSPDDRNAVWSWNSFTWYMASKNSIIYLDIAVWVIGIFTLLSGIVGVSNIMFVSVRERTHEIGIRRAIGAKPRSILTQILAEGVAITALFGYCGIVAGMAVLQILHTVLGDVEGFRNPTVDISIAVQVTLALILAGALAGLFPALKAIKVKPVEALRDE